jgi:hypothetical protein
MNVIMTSLQDAKFPPRRDSVRGVWAPIFIEPIVGSGERVCVGIAAATNAGCEVVQVPALSRLECLYGENVRILISSSEFVLSQLREALASAGAAAFEYWRPEIEGLVMGGVRVSAAGSMTEFIRTALVTSASLVEKLQDQDSDSQSGEGFGISSTRLEQQIKERVVSSRPALAANFNIQHQRKDNHRPAQFGFVGTNVAANFGLLVPINLSQKVKDVKAKLWDLAALRDDRGHLDLFSTVRRFEMLVHRPAADDASFSERQIRSVDEASNELEAEADRKEIIFDALTGADSIAARLLQREAA